MFSQTEFDYLIKLEKKFVDSTQIDFSLNWQKEILSTDGKETFIMDYHKNIVEVSKYTFNERYRTNIVMFRIDMGEFLRHKNPTGEMITGSHIHIYSEEYGPKMAYSLDIIGAKESNTIDEIFLKVLEFLNIEKATIQFTIC